VQARAIAQVAGGGNAFKNLHLPQAAIALKQGAGRLIRSETDRGILVVCDVRLAQMGYGKKLLEGLPPMRRLASGEDWLEALADLAAVRQAPV
jgi:ATP-dependent DNA helicase DinG